MLSDRNNNYCVVRCEFHTDKAQSLTIRIPLIPYSKDIVAEKMHRLSSKLFSGNDCGIVVRFYNRTSGMHDVLRWQNTLPFRMRCQKREDKPQPRGKKWMVHTVMFQLEDIWKFGDLCVLGTHNRLQTSREKEVYSIVSYAKYNHELQPKTERVNWTQISRFEDMWSKMDKEKDARGPMDVHRKSDASIDMSASR